MIETTLSYYWTNNGQFGWMLHGKLQHNVGLQRDVQWDEKFSQKNFNGKFQGNFDGKFNYNFDGLK